MNDRQKVFINSDMTRAESEAAYEHRVQRRQRQRNQQTTIHKSRVVQPTYRPSSTIRSFVDDRVHNYATQCGYYDHAYPAVPPATGSSAVGDVAMVADNHADYTTKGHDGYDGEIYNALNASIVGGGGCIGAGVGVGCFGAVAEVPMTQCSTSVDESVTVKMPNSACADLSLPAEQYDTNHNRISCKPA